MMQFTHTAPPPPIHPSGHGLGLGLFLDLGAPRPPSSLHRPWPGGFPTSSKTLGNFNSAGCMEQLLVHCANAIEANDATLTQQILWVLNNIAPPDGDSNQRLTAAFLRALVARAAKIGCCKMVTEAVAAAVASAESPALHAHRFTAVELASFVDLTPWHRFGYAAANAAILDAVEGCSVVHVVDLCTTHSMQIPTLIDMLANRVEGPPVLRLTAVSLAANAPPPAVDVSYEEIGVKLVNFARSRNISMDFRVVPSSPTDAFTSLIDQLRVRQLVSDGEALVVNCHMLLHSVPDETAGAIGGGLAPLISLRSMLLKSLRSLEPALVVVVDEDADFTASDVVGRLRAAFNYLWIPYDAVDTFLPRGGEQRRRYEAAVAWRIENVVAHEGIQRVERLEPRARWAQRMRGAGFRPVGFGDDAAAEVKGMLDEHAAGWGMRREEEDMVLTWKGHNVVFAAAWAPS